MTAAVAQDLASTLRLKEGFSDRLHNRESQSLEFKQSFNVKNTSAYVRIMVGFANNRGGCIVFGIEDSPRRLRGINVERFDRLDTEKMTDFLKAHITPMIEWHSGIVNCFGVSLGYLAVEPSLDKPVLVTRNSGKDLKEGEILYRYRAQTRPIGYAELNVLLEERLNRERRAWMDHIEKIARAGATNVGILDTARGELHDSGRTLLIDEQLVERLKFIREGHFSEIDGEPTLRLVGNVNEVSKLVAERHVPTDIHMTDLLEAAMENADLSRETAESYLRATADRNTHLVPVFRFAHLAGLDAERAADLLKSVPTSYRKTRENIVKRLLGEIKIEPKGAPPIQMTAAAPSNSDELLTLVNTARQPIDVRRTLASTIVRNPEIVVATLPHLPIVRLCEAIMHTAHLNSNGQRNELSRIVRAMLRGGFETMSSNQKSDVRKAVSYLDQQWYAALVQ